MGATRPGAAAYGFGSQIQAPLDALEDQDAGGSLPVHEAAFAVCNREETADHEVMGAFFPKY